MVTTDIKSKLSNEVIEDVTKAMARFDSAKGEMSLQIGNKNHKCVTMKRVSKDWIVVDHENNAVGYIKPESMVLVESKRYPVEGYLAGA